LAPDFAAASADVRSYLFVDVSLAAVLADLGGDPFDHHDQTVPLQGDGRRPRLRRASLTDEAPHDLLLDKSSSHFS